MKKIKSLILLAAFSVFSSPLFSMDLTEVTATITNAFEGITDDNEGLTVFRSLNIPVGARAESLGTACTALGDDITFFDYNPAASSVLESSEAALFHNAWIGDSALDTLAGTGRYGNLGYGGQLKCFYVPFAEYNMFGDKVAGSYYSETSVTGNMSYNFKPGYYFKGVAVGGNIRASWRSVPDYTDNKTDAIIPDSGLAQSGLGIMVDAGVLFRFNFRKNFASREPNLKVGASLSNIGVALTGFGKSVELDDPLPTKLNIGASYRIINPILITLDLRKPINLQNIPASETFAIGTGAEFTITNFCKVSTGLQLQGGNPKISVGSTFELKKVTMSINYTLDMTSSANPVNHISCSLKAKLPGRAKVRENIQKKIDDNYIEGLRLYALGEYEEAISHWDVAIEAAMQKEMNVTFEPAMNAKVSARRFLESKKRITDMNTFGGATERNQKK